VKKCLTTTGSVKPYFWTGCHGRLHWTDINAGIKRCTNQNRTIYNQ